MESWREGARERGSKARKGSGREGAKEGTRQGGEEEGRNRRSCWFLQSIGNSNSSRRLLERKLSYRWFFSSIAQKR